MVWLNLILQWDKCARSLGLNTSALGEMQNTNERTVTLSYWKLSGQKTGQSGLWGSKTLPPLSFPDTHGEPLVRKKKKEAELMWTEHEWL